MSEDVGEPTNVPPPEQKEQKVTSSPNDTAKEEVEDESHYFSVPGLPIKIRLPKGMTTDNMPPAMREEIQKVYTPLSFSPKFTVSLPTVNSYAVLYVSGTKETGKYQNHRRRRPTY